MAPNTKRGNGILSTALTLALAFGMSPMGLATPMGGARHALATDSSPSDSEGEDAGAWAVTFDANGAPGGHPMRLSAREGDSLVVPECPYGGADGLEFAGWSGSPDGSGGLFLPGQPLRDLSAPGGETTLYATWVRPVDGDGQAGGAPGGTAIDMSDEQAHSAARTLPHVASDEPSTKLRPIREAPAGGTGTVSEAEAVLRMLRTTASDILPISAGEGDPAPKRTIPRTGSEGFHVAAATVTRIADGTVPWDADSSPGNDSGDGNGVVRSFDSIAYNIAYTTALDNPAVPVSEGSVFADVTLPLSPKEARIDIGSLSWMLDKRITYTYADGYQETYADQDPGTGDYMGTLAEADWHYAGESDAWTHGDVVSQAVSGRRYLSAQSNAIPGAGTLSMDVLTSAARNGTIIRPDIRLYSAGTSKLPVSGVSPVVASAAPLYDLRVMYESDTTGRSWLYLNRDEGRTYASDAEGREKGRLYGLGITFALKNSAAAKGFKGVALPTGQVQFDLALETSFLSNSAVEGTPATPTTSVDGYRPFLWDVHESGRPYPDTTNMLGNGIWSGSGGSLALLSRRQMRDFSGTGAAQPRFVPYNEHSDDPASETTKRYQASCYGGGNVFAVATDQPNVWRIVMDGFRIDYKNLEFPSRQINGSASAYLQSSGTLASAYAIVGMTLPKNVTNGTEHLDVSIRNMACMTEGETGLTYRQESVTNNNTSGHNAVVYGPGSYSHRVYYSDNDSWDTGDYQSYSAKKNRVNVYCSTTAETSFKGVNILLKFDDEFGEIPEGTTDATSASVGVVGEGIEPVRYTTLFAAKPDKTGWVDDNELQNATEESLVFFDSIDELNEAGYTCVGVLLEARGEIWKSPAGVLCSMLNIVKTKAEAENGAVYEIMAGSRAWADSSDDPISWKDEAYRHVTPENIPYYGFGDSSWTVDRFTTVSNGNYITSFQYKDGYPQPYYAHFGRYTKTQYDNGRIVGGHVGGTLNGDSALIVGDRAEVNVTSTMVGGEEKIFYDLDNGERTAMFKISAITDFISANQALSSEGITDDLTVTVTLPPSLHYKEGSASVDPQSVTQNPDGSTTLVFRLQDVVIGGEPTEITILATIGHIGQPDDVMNNEALTVETTIVPDRNPAAPSADELTLDDTTIKVIKLAASAIAKEVGLDVGELGGSNWWTMHLGNSAEVDIQNARVLDVLPYNGDGRGTEIHGGYSVTGVSVDLGDAATIQPSSVYAFATTDPAIRQRDASDMDALGNGIWVGLDRSVSGRTVDFSVPASLDASKVTAVKVIYGNIAMREYVHTRINWSPKDGNAQMVPASDGSIQRGMDTYCNTFSQYSNNQAAVVSSNLVTETVVQREIRGMAWLDANHDGIRQDDEQPLSDIPVTLVDENGNPFVSLTSGTPLAGVTGADGSYAFLDVPAGTAYVRFMNSPGHRSLDEYAVTLRKVRVDGQPATEVDSDVQGVNQVNGRLDYMESDAIRLPLAQQLPSAQYSVLNVDAGVTPKSAIWVPAAKKNLDGHALMRPFSMEVVDEDGEVVSTGTSNTSTGWVTFTPIRYEAKDAGTHAYRMREVDDSQPGVAYDLADKAVTVEVTDLGEANMAVSQSSQGAPIAISEGDLAIRGLETELDDLGGGHWRLGVYTPAGEGLRISRSLFQRGKSYTVTYKLKKLGGTLSSVGGLSPMVSDAVVAVDSHDSVPCSTGASLPNDKETHVVQTSFVYIGPADESDPQESDDLWIQPNIGTSDAVAIDMWDLEITENPSVMNEYHAYGDWLPSVRKTLLGKPIADGQFEFELLDEDENVISRARNDEDGNVTFPRIRYGNDDRGQAKIYYIREVDEGRPGYSYEQNTRTLRVVVTDNDDGTLRTAVTGIPDLLDEYAYEGSTGTRPGDRTGHFLSESSGDPSERPAIRIDENALAPGNAYLLQWKTKGGNGVASPTSVMADLDECEVVSLTIDGTETSPESLSTGIPFAVAGADHVVEIFLRTPDSWDSPSGIRVFPAGNGSTAGTYETYGFRLEQTSKFPLLTNAYHATGGWTPTATKTLSGRDIESNKFMFEAARLGDDLTSQIGTDATHSYDAASGVMTVLSTGAPTAITLPSPPETVMYGGSGTWSFELSAEGSSVTALLDENNVLATGGTAGDNDLHGDPSSYWRQRIGHVDGNEAPRSPADKSMMEIALADSSWHAADQTYTNNSPQNARQIPIGEAGTTITVSGGTAIRIRNLRFASTESLALNTLGDVTFPYVAYDESDIGKTYVYRIREQDSQGAGYAYDHHAETVTVSVADNGDGTLTVTQDASADGRDGTAFANSYAAEGSVTLTAWKILNSRPLQDQEFEFEAYDSDNRKVATGKNDADGIVRMSGIRFDQSDVGNTYLYEVREKAGTDPTVSYSSQAFRYAVTVADNGDGTLSFDTKNVDASGQDTTDLPIFKNSLVDGSVAIEKRTTGGVGDETFQYLLRLHKEDGTPIAIDDMDEHLSVSPLDGGAGGNAAPAPGANPLMAAAPAPEQASTGTSDPGTEQGQEGSADTGQKPEGDASRDSSQGHGEAHAEDAAATEGGPDFLGQVTGFLGSAVAAPIMSAMANLGLVSVEGTVDGTFTIEEVMSGIDYSYTGGAQKFVAPYTGQYKLEVWGAAGGGRTGASDTSRSGTGGYSQGTVTLTQGQTIYVICGGKGTLSSGAAGGYNGGGNGYSTGAGGGGMTHISFNSNPVTNTSWDPSGTIIVAGGGGGADDQLAAASETLGGANDGSGGNGGGLEGGNAYRNGVQVSNSVGFYVAEVSQGGGCGRGGTQTNGFSQGMGESATFATDTGGAGGGWYGGYVTNLNNGGAGGGSGYLNPSYISGGTTSAGGNPDNGRARITCTLVVDPNGGTWDDGSSASTDVRVYTQDGGSKTINDPTREGYRFVGWVEDGDGRLANGTSSAADGAFSSGANGVTVYDMSGNGGLSLSRGNATTPYGSDALILTHDRTKETTPQLGGFSLPQPMVAGHTYLVLFSAKVPIDYYVQSAVETDADCTVSWLTDRRGTGDWRTYAYTVTVSGTGGTLPLPLPEGFSDLSGSSWTHQLPAQTPTTYDPTTGMSTTTVNSIGGWEALVSTPIAVTPGQRYHVEFDYKTITDLSVYPGYGGWFGLGVYDTANPLALSGTYTPEKALCDVQFDYAAMTGKEHVTMTFTAPASGQVYMQIQGGYLVDYGTYQFSIGNFGTRTSVYLTRDPLGTQTTEEESPSAENMSWQVAYADTFDVTGTSTYQFSSGATRLTAQWEPISYKVHYHYDNDDDYLPGQKDTLGMTFDWDKDSLLTGCVRTGAASDPANAWSTGTGGSDMGVSVTDGHLTISQGGSSQSMSGTTDPTVGNEFSFRWTASTGEGYAYFSPTDATQGVRGQYPLSGESDGEAMIGSPPGGGWPGVHASDYVWRVPYDLGETVSMPHPTRIGYRFLGWDTKPDGTGTRYSANQTLTNLVSEGQVDLYAQWELRTYQVLFDANTGAGNMPSQTFTWNQSQPLSPNTFQKFNYVFDGWNTKADGTGTAYADTQSVRNILEGDVSSGNYQITLYAQWRKVSNSSQTDDGEWLINVPANGRLTISDLPAGASYEVVELPKADWVLTSQENTSGTIVPLETQTARFANRYSPNSTSLVLSTSKLLGDGAPQGSGDFWFVLSKGGVEVDRKPNNGGAVTFDPLEFDASDLNQTYVYDIAEVQGTDPAVRYDARHKQVTVTVTQGTSGLAAEASYKTLVPNGSGGTAPSDEDARVFRNESIPGSLSVSKVTTGTTPASAGKEFAIDVSLIDMNGSPLPGTYTASSGETITDGSGVIHVSGGQTVTIPDLPAKTQYVLSERAVPGFSQTASTGATGTIAANATSVAMFTNAYSASGTATIQASKVLAGRPDQPLANGEFSFLLSDEEGNELTSAVCMDGGTVTFPDLSYDEGDAGHTYRYRITEVIDPTRTAFIKFDESDEWVSVTVTDEGGTGTLVTRVTYDAPRPTTGSFGTAPSPHASGADPSKANAAHTASGDARTPRNILFPTATDETGQASEDVRTEASEDGTGSPSERDAPQESASGPRKPASDAVTEPGHDVTEDKTDDGKEKPGETDGEADAASEVVTRGGKLSAALGAGTRNSTTDEDEGAVFTNRIRTAMPETGKGGGWLMPAALLVLLGAIGCLIALLRRRMR